MGNYKIFMLQLVNWSCQKRQMTSTFWIAGLTKSVMVHNATHIYCTIIVHQRLTYSTKTWCLTINAAHLVIISKLPLEIHNGELHSVPLLWTGISIWISNHIHSTMCNVLTFNGVLLNCHYTWLRNHIPYFYMDVITLSMPWNLQSFS